MYIWNMEINLFTKDMDHDHLHYYMKGEFPLNKLKPNLLSACVRYFEE